MFKIGQKVVCVNASGNTLLTKGKIHTIFGIKSNPCCGSDVIVNIGRPYKYTTCSCLIKKRESNWINKNYKFNKNIIIYFKQMF